MRKSFDHRRIVVGLTALMMVMLTACTPAPGGPIPTATPAASVVPTTAATVTPAESATPSPPTATRLPPMQVPPTWTATSNPPTATPPPTLELLPTETVTVTPAVSPTRSVLDAAPTQYRGEVYLEGCSGFTPTSYSVPRVGLTETDVTVAWNAVPGVEYYEVWLINPQRKTVELLRPVVSSATFQSNRFVLRGGYGWEVVPILRGLRACPSITGEIIVE